MSTPSGSSSQLPVPPPGPMGQGPKPPRPPRRPIFLWRPFGLQALLYPLLALLLSVFGMAFDRSVYSWKAVGVFFVVLGICNGRLLAVALEERVLYAAGPLAGLTAALVFNEPRATTFFLLSLAIFVVVRLSDWVGALSYLFATFAAGVAVVLFGVINALLAGALANAVGAPGNLILMGALASYPFLCAGCAAFLPVEPGWRGVVDAALVGARAGLYGIAIGTVLALAVARGLEQALGELVVIQALALVLGICVGNYVGIRQLFLLATFIEEDLDSGALPPAPPAP